MPGRSRIDTRLSLRVTTPGQVALSVAVAATAQPVHEMLTIDPSWGPSARMVRLGHGARFHVLDVRSGDVFVHYQAEVPAGPAPAAEPLTLADLVRYTRPSRYCPSDRLAGFAVAEFGRVDAGLPQVREVVRCLGERLSYVSGSSGPTDDAIDTLLSGQGVCRDYAHLSVAVCRALAIPARFVSVYAAGLAPMDFHAVFEAAVDGHWHLFDATGIAPRPSMTRVATGRDAADTAFLPTIGSQVDLLNSEVTVTVDPELPVDDPNTLVARR